MEAARKQLLERFRAHLKSEGLKNTKQRQAIAEVFFDSEVHLSLNDLLERAQADQPNLGYATVYRTMKLMVDCGVANEHKFAESDLALFEPNLAGEHHDHLICVDCGRIVEFEDDLIEERQEAIAARHAFRVADHRLEIYGRCLRDPCEHRPKQ